MDYASISYYIIRLAYRFKRTKINVSERIDYSLPFSDDLEINVRNTLSTIDLIMKRFSLNQENIEIYLNRFQDRYININLSRYCLKKYKIKLKFVLLGKVIKPDPQVCFYIKSYNFLSILSVFKLIPFRKKRIPKNLKNKKIVEVVSMNQNKVPYKIPHLEENLDSIFFSIDFKDIFKYGFNKLEGLLFIIIRFQKLISKINLNDILRIIKYNLFLDYLQININRIYIKNILILLNNIKVKYLFCSHRSFYFEKLIYKACKLSKVKSISYDFSLGYPIRNTFKKNITLTTHPDIYLVSSNFRQDHYRIANQSFINSGNTIEIINCTCMQVGYARKKSKIRNKTNLNDNLFISIFDNNYGENTTIRLKYTKDLVRIISKFNNNISCIAHSKFKYNYLENELYKNNIKYLKALKGDFNLAEKSNLIISIGFQGSAIKAAFAFNKPIIFFSSDDNYFKNFVFSDEKLHNQKVLKTFKKLVLNNNQIESLLSSKDYFFSKENEIINISNKFLDLVEISDEIPSVFSFLKNLE